VRHWLTWGYRGPGGRRRTLGSQPA
jgi:hypothetical protein